MNRVLQAKISATNADGVRGPCSTARRSRSELCAMRSIVRKHGVDHHRFDRADASRDACKEIDQRREFLFESPGKIFFRKVGWTCQETL